MELTYKVRGADGKEYGPVTLEQLGTWVRERRLIPHQEVKRSDMEHWAPAGSFTEFQGLFNEVGVPISAAAQGPGPAGGLAAPSCGPSYPPRREPMGDRGLVSVERWAALASLRGPVH